MINIKTIKPSVQILTPENEIKSFPKRIEKAGRICYKSEYKIHENSADEFVKNIIKRGHESVLEHCSISCLFTISRACSHQLVRHRIASFSQESQRYVNYNKKNEIRIIAPINVLNNGMLTEQFISSVKNSVKSYELLLNNKTKPEDARYVLPNCVASDIVMTANIRELRHIIKIRTDSNAQWEIREVFNNLNCELMRIIPSLFV